MNVRYPQDLGPPSLLLVKYQVAGYFQGGFPACDRQRLYRTPLIRDNVSRIVPEAGGEMSRIQRKSQALLNELIDIAQGLDIEVRTERLLREVGYHVYSGSCRLRGKKLLILDHNLSVRDQVDLLVDELRRYAPDPTVLPPHLKGLL